MMLSVASGRSVDLRVEPVEEVLGRVEQRLLVDLDRATVVRKRRSVGARTNRGTWVRVERREPARVRDHGWNGTECAEALTGIAKPDWLESAAWHDSSDGAMWRADETTLLPGQPVGNSVLATDPQLPDEWWSELGASLDALAGQRTARIATPDTELITQALVDQTIQTAFSSQADTAIRQWVPAHADLNWANTTGPQFCLFDWEDWGTRRKAWTPLRSWEPPRRPGSRRTSEAGAKPRPGEPGRKGDDAVRLREVRRARRPPGRPQGRSCTARGRAAPQGASDDMRPAARPQELPILLQQLFVDRVVKAVDQLP